MALPEPIPRREIILDVTSTAVDYDIPFPFIFDMDVEIAVSTVAFPDTFSRLAYPTGYTLTGAGAPIGGTVHLVAAPQVGAKIRVRGVSAANASEEVVRGVRYNYLAVEQALLRLGWGLQEVSRDAAAVLTVADELTEAVDLASGKAATAVSAAQSAAASAQSAAQSAEDAAATAALFDPANYYLKTAFKSDSTANAPVKYDAAGGFTAKWLTLSRRGDAVGALAAFDADTGYDTGINFLRNGALCWQLASKADGSFGLWNFGAASWAWIAAAASNVVGFAQVPQVNGSSIKGWDLIVEDQKSSGTQGGTNVVGVQTRILNTILVNTIGATLASNVVTLPAGTYDFEWDAPSVNTGGHQSRLYNVTAGGVIGYGSSQYSANSASIQIGNVSSGRARVAFAVATQVRLEHYMTQVSLVGVNGLGQSTTAPIEVYANLRARKIA